MADTKQYKGTIVVMRCRDCGATRKDQELFLVNWVLPNGTTELDYRCGRCLSDMKGDGMAVEETESYAFEGMEKDLGFRFLGPFCTVCDGLMVEAYNPFVYFIETGEQIHLECIRNRAPELPELDTINREWDRYVRHEI